MENYNIAIDKSCIDHINRIKQKQGNEGKFLRISVAGGGCSGFQYLFDLDNSVKDEDIILYKNSDEIYAVTDNISIDLIDNSKIEYVKDLGASYFKISNPNAKNSCGCGSSFNV